MMAALPAPAARGCDLSSRFITTTSIRALTLAACVSVVVAARSTADTPPGNRLELGFEERVRSQNWDNSTDCNAQLVDARHQWRFRSRAWAKLSLGANNDFVLGLDDESRRLSTPMAALQMDEIVFETLYLEHRLADGASIRTGRQNLQKGDGFILQDGSSLDGSRTAYLDAVDLGWTAGKSRLDLMLISDPYRDRCLPRVHDRTKSLSGCDEDAFGLYWSDAGRQSTVLDAYYFFKAETGDTRAHERGAAGRPHVPHARRARDA